MTGLPSSARAVPSDESRDRDLGFGALVARETRQRLLNRDGSFNVRRTGLPFFRSLSPYHQLLTISWTRFLALVAAAYVIVNGLFGAFFVACGPHALTGMMDGNPLERYAQAFFFSVHTLATIGYGDVAPASLAANLLVTLESLIGLLGFGIVAGLMFARFSRPTARIIFSDAAVVAPYRGIRAFEFRVANERSNQLIEVEAKVLLSRRQANGSGNREFLELGLERRRVTFLPLAWTVVHPIDETSPLAGETAASLRAADAEFLVLLSGFDETFSQTVHARSSYRMDEVVFGARFANILRTEDDVIGVDIGRLHEIEPVPG